MAEDVVRLTAQIVAAYLGHNELALGDITNLINDTYAALLQTALPVSVQVERQQPAVSVKKSVTPDVLVCLECGKPQKMLKRHLAATHGIAVDEYRAKWSLPTDYPMVAPNYAIVRSDMAKKIGLGRKPERKTLAPDNAAQPDNAAPKTGYRYPASRWSKKSE